jgi:hypothetical protein
MISIDCANQNPPHTHTYPDDWVFGGANGVDPRADVRWRPTTYIYYSGTLEVLHTTQVPLCDDDALDRFTNVAGYGPEYDPVVLMAVREDGTRELLPWKYNKSDDTLTPREFNDGLR